ncbi:MAG: glycoside hydrolase family 2 TIM barrel-domain containing protein [Polyangiaceae bacterium]
MSAKRALAAAVLSSLALAGAAWAQPAPSASVPVAPSSSVPVAPSSVPVAPSSSVPVAPSSSVPVAPSSVPVAPSSTVPVAPSSSVPVAPSSSVPVAPTAPPASTEGAPSGSPPPGETGSLPAVPLPHGAPPGSPESAAPAPASGPMVARIVRDDGGMRLQIDGKDTLVRGMNWGYSPIGTNYSYSLWSKPDAFIERVLERDMGLLRDMGVNAIRLFSDVPPKWITWIYDRFGIFTSVNHLMGRYGFVVNGVLVPHIDYNNPAHRKAILDDLQAKVDSYKNTRGLLFWLLGNENNYGLTWTSFEIEALPGKEDAARAESLYTLFGEAIARVKGRDTNHPVAIVNGDAQYIDLVAKHCKGLDVFGANVYRGSSARDLFDKVRTTLGVPLLFTEFGADAYDAKAGHEDHVAQAEYLRAQWQEIYEQTSSKGRSGNAIGGFIFQWDDGWWKVGQESNLDVHDTVATWPNQGYPKDFVEGQNNMNEEWFGLVSKDRSDENGFYEVHPRSAYYLLREAFKLDAYAPDTTPTKIRATFERLSARDFAVYYNAENALAQTAALGALRISGASMDLGMYLSGGSERTLRPPSAAFDHTESFFLDVTLQPSPRVTGRVSFNVIGNVAANRLDRIFYETRGKVSPIGPANPDDPPIERDRLAIYQAELSVDQPWFRLDGFYRTGHYHWGNEGDFFSLYREANYGPSLDRYNGEAPFGVVFSGKKGLEGLKLAIGPQLYWGANPTVIAKYRREFGPAAVTAMYQEDLAQASNVRTSSATPQLVARRATVHVNVASGNWQVGVGGIMSSPQQVGRDFTFTRATESGTGGYLGSGYEVLKDTVKWFDTLGGKAKIVYEGGLFRFYVEGQLRGLVAGGGPDETITLTPWTMRGSGLGNQVSGLAGFTVNAGSFQIAPNVLYQQPLIAPMPNIADRYDPASGTYSAGFRARNVLADPFVVLDNRETLGGELLLIYDPTPATWYGSWDRETREDAKLAGSIDFVYRHQPTVRDANIGFLATGTPFAFDRSPPAQDVWDVTGTWVSNFADAWRLSGSVFVGQGQARGADPRLVTRAGGTARLTWNKALFTTSLLFNDWGPFDYHKDFNLTYPFQWYGDLSLGMSLPVLNVIGTRLGFRWQYRTLDAFSEGFPESPPAADASGSEYEVGTYMRVSL